MVTNWCVWNYLKPRQFEDNTNGCLINLDIASLGPLPLGLSKILEAFTWTFASSEDKGRDNRNSLVAMVRSWSSWLLDQRPHFSPGAWPGTGSNPLPFELSNSLHTREAQSSIRKEGPKQAPVTIFQPNHGSGPSNHFCQLFSLGTNHRGPAHI